jgi:hypothetical protein
VHKSKGVSCSLFISRHFIVTIFHQQHLSRKTNKTKTEKICLLSFQGDPLLIGRETWLVAGRVTGYTMASLVLASDGRVLVESSSAPILEIHVVVFKYYG